ncbi:hypothetical protein GUJ93_ZPchr0004g38133 [Zizania palustris]|uniref:Uncharacterized protein n=1 Tax=Zizania palustris TaxID=103762 RepID=A0A8J5RZ02_ZIZPA|nr:hypothetical protein GUJ93_ZPchr0004g38133 [Zizania palustris]
MPPKIAAKKLGAVDGPDQIDENTHRGSGGDVINDGYNQMANDDDGGMANGGDAINDGHNQMTNECDGGMENGGDAINDGHNQMTNEGKIRHVVPLVAAKFATECNVIVRNHVPMLKHWKDYKKYPGLLSLFIGKLGAKFDINTSDAVVENACFQMMKVAVRQ